MLAAAIALGLASGLHVLAHGGIAPVEATDRFEPELQQDLLGLQDVTVDTGWFPAGSPVQLRLFVHAADSIVIEMPGDAFYDFTVEAVDFVGDVDGGLFSIDIGAQVEACVRFDVAGLVWESEIFGPFDYAITSEATFSPYLLPGDPERPVEIDDATDGVTVASVPIVPDIIVASGGLDIDVAADVSASLQAARIDVLTMAGNAAVVDTEAVPAALAADPGDEPLAADGTLVVELRTSPTIIVRPHLTMSIAGQDFEIFGIDVPVDLPPIDDTIALDPEPLSFDRPPAPPDSGDDTGDGGTGDGHGGSGEDGDDTSAVSDDAGNGDDAGSGSTGDTDAAQIAELDSGCGCRSGRVPSSAAWLAFGVVALARRRRRRG